jgi:hypothetical protein
MMPVSGVGGESTTTLEQLQGAASRAAETVGEGSGNVHGTLVHTTFKQGVESSGGLNVKTEISYKLGEVVDYVTSGSVRLDVAEFDAHAVLQTIYDLKTGLANMSLQRIAQIRANLPTVSTNVPIQVVRP